MQEKKRLNQEKNKNTYLTSEYKDKIKNKKTKNEAINSPAQKITK